MADGQTVGDTPRQGKSILLFSDGTGNSSSKLFKTNVWRTYEAVDLGPPRPGLRQQIAYYDDGVGTSSFRPLAVLGGIFGIGLKRNVLDLYRFACRNYTPGDTIYAFGFSRGAFTIRLVIALIASQGLVPAETEAALERGTADAWRAYRRRYLPRRLQWPTKTWRAMRAAVIRALRRPEDRYHLRRNRRPDIRFVGVWDTVAAYGGPSVEITRAIDDWFYPLSMPNYALSKRVGRARHALALDDERDAFQPLVWDELAERDLVTRGLVGEDRLRQFWFTGMHADVGGGYPDESLSYVSLLWMLEEAQAAGLRTLDVITDRHRALANSAGPIHDSRAGLNSYYRYLPRRIDALLDPPAPETRLAWPPERARGGGRGLLTAARIHESALARIVHGTDRYAPLTIPETFEIHPPQRDGENAAQPTSGAGATSATPDAPGAAVPLLSPAERAALRDPARNAARAAMMPAIWDLVWWRRIAYFATVLVTAALASMPLWPAPPGMERWCEDSRCLLPGLFSPLKAVLPGAATPWIDRYTTQPVMAGGLLLLLAALMIVGGRLGRTIHARSATAWDCVTRGTAPQPPRGGVARAIRGSALWLRTLYLVKWRLLPGLAALAVLLAIVAIPLALPMQWWLAKAERDGTLCPDPETRGDGTGAPIPFMPDRPCTDLQQTLKPRVPYVVTLRVTRQWCDGGLRADPVRGVAGGWWLSPLRFHRRVTSANWLKPLAVVRRPDAEDTRTSGAKVRIDPLDFTYRDDGTYRARIVAPAQGGRLYMALNDAAPPFRPDLFYANNSGAATVTVAEESAPSCRDDGCAIALPPPPATTCGAPVAP